MNNKRFFLVAMIALLSGSFYYYVQAISTRDYQEGLVRVSKLYKKLQNATPEQLADSATRNKFHDEFKSLEKLFGANFSHSDFVNLRIKVKKLGLYKSMVVEKTPSAPTELPPPPPSTIGIPAPLKIEMTFERAKEKINMMIKEKDRIANIQGFINSLDLSDKEKDNLLKIVDDKFKILEKAEKEMEEVETLFGSVSDWFK